MIPVNKPTIKNSNSMLKDIKNALDSRYVTNFGPYHNEFENKIQRITGGYTQLCNNATTGLIASISCLLEETGEVITPAFTFSATTQAIKILGHTPVYADCMSNSFNICPSEVERLITNQTKAIVAVQCYGFTDGVPELSKIAKKFDIPLIFDAAHAFMSTVNGSQLSQYADAVVYSFHATKLFNCIEGGAVVLNTKKLKTKIKSFINFGMDANSEIKSNGLNGKLSELHAVVGLHNLRDIQDDIVKRRTLYQIYQSTIVNPKLTHFKFNSDFNFAYFPLLFDNEKSLLKVLKNLNSEQVFARRYFYPLAIPLGATVKSNLVNAISYSDRVLCLPLYPDLKKQDIIKITNIINAI